MKLLDYCSSIPSMGIHHYAALLSQGFHRFGLDVKIVSSPGETDPGVRARLKNEGIDVIDFPWSEKRGLLNALKSAAFLKEVIQDFQPDVIHTWGIVYSLRFWLALKKASLKKKIPIITTLSSIRHGSIEEWPARIMAARILNSIPGKVCVQCSSEKFKMIKAGLSKDKLRVTYLFVDFDLLNIDLNNKINDYKIKFGLNNRITIVYLAQFIKRKGHLYLLNTAKEIVKKYPNCLFILAGDGPLLTYLQHKVNLNGLSKYIIFPGRIPIDDVPALLRASDIGLVCSLAETYGSAIVEPLLLDLPVITTDVGIAQDLARVGGVTMVPSRNSEELTKALIKYIENPKIAQSEAKKGKAFVTTICNFNVVVQNYMNVFQECLT